MRKYILISLVIILFAFPAQAANKFYWATGLTGGGAALDGIDGAGLAAGDAAIVIIDSGTNVPMVYFYRLQASSAALSSPNIIRPTANAGTSSWHLANIFPMNLTGNAPTPVSNAGSITLTVAQMNTWVFITAAGTVDLPEVVASSPTVSQVTPGAWSCVYSTVAGAVRVNPHANDGISLNGAARSANGTDIYSASAVGDFICLIADSASGWSTLGRSGTWTVGS